MGRTYASFPYNDYSTQGLVNYTLRAYRQDASWNTNATEVQSGGPSAGLPPPNTVNQRPKYIQQSANQIMNTPFLQLTESLTSGHYARSPETVRRQMLCSTFLLRLARHLLVPTPLSAIPFVSTLYQQFEVCGSLFPKLYSIQKPKLARDFRYHAVGLA